MALVSLQDTTEIRSAIRATRVVNITDRVQDLIDQTRNKNINRNNMRECCRYPYQLLDTFCASLTEVCVCAHAQPEYIAYTWAQMH